MEEFTEEEKNILSPFFTNLDKPVFVLKNLPEVVMGALFSRYSRSPKSLRRLLLDEFINDQGSGFREITSHAKETGQEQLIAIKKAEEFYDRVLVGYGDDSVAELGGAHIACEGISNIASKVLEDARIGISPLEKSTRYVFFDDKAHGKYKYYRDPEIIESKHIELYEETCDMLFDAYSGLVEPMKKFVMEKFPLEEGTSERAYKSTVKAKACDVLRGLLPAAALTNVGLYGNGRAFEYLITKMYSYPLRESRELAGEMHSELLSSIPSFVKRATGQYGNPTISFLRETREAMQKTAVELLGKEKASETKGVELIEYDQDAEEKVLSAALYPFLHLPLKQVKEKIKRMGKKQRQRIIRECLQRRENRRHKPGRAFENTYYTFDILANYGAFRDLHRHRLLTQERQDLTTRHGYTMPVEITEIGAEQGFREAMQQAKNAFETIEKELPKQAQYIVPLAYKIRWYFKMSLREVYYLCELRSTQQGHPDYRKIAQEMFRQVQKAHPSLAEYMKFVDLKEYALERLEAEKRTDKKIAEIEKKRP